VVELGRELGAVAAECLQLRLQGIALAIFFVPTMNRSLERVDGCTHSTGGPVERRLVPILPHRESHRQIRQ
jgi:hypothetical protein